MNRFAHAHATRRLTASALALAACALLALGSGRPARASEALRWHTSYAEAMREARASGRPVFVYFTGSDWCAFCGILHDEVLNTNAFEDWAPGRVVLLEIDLPRSTTLGELQRRQNIQLVEAFGIDSFPTIVYLDRNGREIGRQGYAPGGAAKWIRTAESTLGRRPAPQPALTAEAPAPRPSTGGGEEHTRTETEEDPARARGPLALARRAVGALNPFDRDEPERETPAPAPRETAPAAEPAWKGLSALPGLSMSAGPDLAFRDEILDSARTYASPIPADLLRQPHSAAPPAATATAKTPRPARDELLDRLELPETSAPSAAGAPLEAFHRQVPLATDNATDNRDTPAPERAESFERAPRAARPNATFSVEARHEDPLLTRVSVLFDGIPLETALGQLRRSGTLIMLDKRIDASQPIRIGFRNLEVEKIIDWICTRIGADYYVEGTTVYIHVR